MANVKFNMDDHVKVYSTYYNNFLQITLSNLPAKFIPYLRFSEGDDCYTDGSIINIGKHFVTAKEEDEVIMQVLYVLGHEAQHVQSSPRKYWMWGLENGVRVMVENLSAAILGVVTSDVEEFCKHANPKGYHFSKEGLMEVAHFILNSVEDGRIEKIRCKSSKLFKDEMYVYRATNWKKNPVEKGQKNLVTIMNQILTLATMGIYQKGYQAAYADTQIDLFVDSLLPMIAQCVNARSCHDCGIFAANIYKAITPYVQEYFKGNTDKDLQKSMQKTGQAGVGNPNMYPCDSNKEQKAEGDGSEAAGSSNEKKEASGSSKETKSSSLDGKDSKDGKNMNGESKMSDKLVKNKGINSIDMDAKRPDMTDKEIDDMLASIKEQAKADLYDHVKDVKSYGARRIPSIKEVFDTAAPVKPLEKSTCSEKFRFEEKKRTYPMNLDMPQHLAQRAKAFARKLEKVFQAEDIPELENRMSGSINNRDIYKIAVGELDFWKKTEEAGELDVCCYFLCDNSGSMGYGKESKRDYAWQTLTVIEEGFKKYMPLKITAFQLYGRKVIHDCAKGWEERYNKSCSFNYLLQGGGGSCNADGYSIRIATQELLERPEHQKILFVLSDGLPAYSNGDKDTALAAEEARKAGIIVVPIYFSDETCADGSVDLNTSTAKKFKEIYVHNCIITIPEHIEDNVIKILTKLVTANM